MCRVKKNYKKYSKSNSIVYDFSKNQKTYQKYTKYNPELNKTYSGRTSGYGSPAENIRNRDINHHMNNKGYGPAKLDKSSTNYESICGREQMLIDEYGGAQSDKGISGNVIRGIGKNNKKIELYLDAAEKEFGKIE